MIVLSGTTSTGQSDAYSEEGPFTKVAVEVVGGTGTVAVEGRIGSDWTALIAASTFTSAGLVATSTGNFLVSAIRANVSAWGSTSEMVVHLLGV